MDNPHKIVTVEDLAQTLHAMHYAQVLPQTPLMDLEIVHQLLPESASPILRDHLLMDWLTQLIFDQFNQHRNHLELTPVSLGANQAQVIELLQEAFRRYSKLLQAWTLLYVRFARADFAFMMSDLADLTAHHERTLRRRQQLAYQRLLAHILYLNSLCSAKVEVDESEN